VIRVQIQLSAEQLDALRRLGVADGRSVSDLVREGVDALLRSRPVSDRRKLRERALLAVGRYRSGVPELARDHDRYLEDVLGE
jgi:hypothetical protein